MPKIWILLLLVGVIQFARSYPALENEFEEDEIDPMDFITFEFEDDVDDEERGKVGDWFKDKWKKLKTKFKKVGKKLKEAFKKGKEFLKKKGLKIEPLTCEGSVCRSCLIMSLAKKKFCLELVISSEALKITLTRQKDDQEPKAIFPPLNIKLNKMPSCMKFSKFLGDICILGVEGKIKSSEGKPNVNCCLVVLMKKFSAGAKICMTLEDGKIKFKFKPKLFAGEVDNGTVIEAGESADEGKPVDPSPE
uniref:Venom redulysin 5 n=1 Tax=Oncocephalus sp. TaxID=2944721 RepID=A0AB38ZEH1_9HEMI